MADNFSVSLVGAEALFERLDGLVDERKLAMAMGKACAIVERSAKEKAPKGNGELRRSITSKVEHNGQEIVGTVFTPLEYAPYVEFGTGLFAENGGRQDVPWNYQDDEGNWHTTSGMKPQPYMRPALNENRELIKRTLREGMVNND